MTVCWHRTKVCRIDTFIGKQHCTINEIKELNVMNYLLDKLKNAPNTQQQQHTIFIFVPNFHQTITFTRCGKQCTIRTE